MITAADAQAALDLLRGAGIPGLREARADVWAAVINAAPGLDVEGRELLPAAIALSASHRGPASVGHLIDAIRERGASGRAVARERIRAEVEAHGLLLPDGLGDDVGAELAWRRVAAAAVGAGATREQAEASAWRAIGRTPPAARPMVTDGHARIQHMLADTPPVTPLRDVTSVTPQGLAPTHPVCHD